MRSFVRQVNPVAVAGLAGVVLLCVGARLPWAQVVIDKVTVRPVGTPSDAQVVFMFGLVIATMLLSSLNRTSRTRAEIVRFLGVTLLGVPCLVTTLLDAGDAHRIIGIAGSSGARVDVELLPGIYVALAGATLVAAVGGVGLAGTVVRARRLRHVRFLTASAVPNGPQPR